MSPPAQHVLERLLRRGETARRRGQSASLSMRSARDAAEYLALRSLTEIETFHAHIALAERDGGIEVQRDRCGDGERLERLSVANLTALARHLGTIPLDQQADAAADALSRWQAQFPIIHDVLIRWREGRKVPMPAPHRIWPMPHLPWQHGKRMPATNASCDAKACACSVKANGLRNSRRGSICC